MDTLYSALSWLVRIWTDVIPFRCSEFGMTEPNYLFKHRCAFKCPVCTVDFIKVCWRTRTTTTMERPAGQKVKNFFEHFSKNLLPIDRLGAVNRKIDLWKYDLQERSLRKFFPFDPPGALLLDMWCPVGSPEVYWPHIPLQWLVAFRSPWMISHSLSRLPFGMVSGIKLPTGSSFFSLWFCIPFMHGVCLSLHT